MLPLREVADCALLVADHWDGGDAATRVRVVLERPSVLGGRGPLLERPRVLGGRRPHPTVELGVRLGVYLLHHLPLGVHYGRLIVATAVCQSLIVKRPAHLDVLLLPNRLHSFLLVRGAMGQLHVRQVGVATGPLKGR